MPKYKTVTVNQLHRILGKLIEQGEGRLRVCVDKSTFTHNCESDGVLILPVDGCRIEATLIANEDGGSTDENGIEHYRRTIVLFGQRGTGFKSVLHAEAVEEFIRDIKWNGKQDDMSVTLVASNIRNFAAHLRNVTGAG
jgi:hypothetical protein